MARSKRTNVSGKRGYPNPTARPPLLSRIVLRPIDLSVFEDRRRFHPDRLRPPMRLPGLRAGRLVTKQTIIPPVGKRPGVFISEPLGFRIPKDVVVCMRRKSRREVILALNKGGAGARSPKRRNEWSDVQC